MQYTTSYDDLISELATFVEDTSAEYTSSIQKIINRAEDVVLKDLDLDMFYVSLDDSLNFKSTLWDKPAGMSRLRSLFVHETGEHMQRRSREFVQAYRGLGLPLYYNEGETGCSIAPTPDKNYVVSVIGLVKPTPLSTGNQTNWITDHAADLLLLASLAESELFLIAPERVQEFIQGYRLKLAQAQNELRGLSSTDYTPVRNAAYPIERVGE